MARDAVTPTTWVANAGTAKQAATTIDATLVTNGVKIACSGMTQRLVIEVANTAGTDKIVTVQAADSVTSGYPAGSLPFAGVRGDLSVTVVATSGVQYIVGLESARFNQQATGEVWIDFASGMTGTIRAYLLPWPAQF